jgi:hypothetical protein
MRHPRDKFTRATDVLSVVAILYTVIIVPFRLGFDSFPTPDEWQFWFDFVVDAFFITDIVLT